MPGFVRQSLGRVLPPKKKASTEHQVHKQITLKYIQAYLVGYKVTKTVEYEDTKKLRGKVVAPPFMIDFVLLTRNII